MKYENKSLDNIVNTILRYDCRKARKQNTYRITKGEKMMLSNNLIKSTVQSEAYKNRNKYWVCKKVDMGLFSVICENVFSGSQDDCKQFIDMCNQNNTDCTVSYRLFLVDDCGIINTPGRRHNRVQNWLDFCHQEYDRLGSEVQEVLDINKMLIFCRVESFLYGSVQSDIFTKNLKMCGCCGKYHTVESFTNGSQYCNDCADNYTKCPVCGRYVLKSKMIDYKSIKTPLTYNEKPRYIKGACEECVDEITSAYKRCGYYHDAPSDTPLFYNASRKNTPLSSEPESGTRYFGIEFEYSISDWNLVDYGNDDYDYEDDLNEAVETVLSNLARQGYNRHIYSESDSSIEPYGYEFITNPMSLEYFRDTDFLKCVTDTASRAGFDEHESCGMHIHVNRGSLSKYSVAKMNMILTSLEYRYDYVISTISGRENGCNDWSRIVNYSDAYYCDNIADRYACIYDRMRNVGRYVALNSQNKNTVEFRFFGSTMDTELIMERLYFVNAVCTYANNHTLEQCMNVSVDTMIEWDNRTKELFDRYL